MDFNRNLGLNLGLTVSVNEPKFRFEGENKEHRNKEYTYKPINLF